MTSSNPSNNPSNDHYHRHFPFHNEKQQSINQPTSYYLMTSILSSSTTMESTPVQTPRLHLVRELGLNPKRAHGADRESHHEGPVSDVTHLVHHEGEEGHVAPRGLGGVGGDGRGARFGTAGGPDLFVLGHAVLEEGVDFGDFGLG
eukprot:35294_1